VAGIVERKEGLANSDSPTNLMWRLQNDFDTHARVQAANKVMDQEDDERASFTEITLDMGH